MPGNQHKPDLVVKEVFSREFGILIPMWPRGEEGGRRVRQGMGAHPTHMCQTPSLLFSLAQVRDSWHAGLSTWEAGE